VLKTRDELKHIATKIFRLCYNNKGDASMTIDKLIVMLEELQDDKNLRQQLVALDKKPRHNLLNTFCSHCGQDEAEYSCYCGPQYDI